VSDFQLNADLSEEQSSLPFIAGASLAKEHFALGHYAPQLNPHPRGSSDGNDWRRGYEGAWEAAFYAKRGKQQP
jgi:hypothetical protein